MDDEEAREEDDNSGTLVEDTAPALELAGSELLEPGVLVEDALPLEGAPLVEAPFTDDA
mgnify:CR=1 FL=1